MTNRRDFLKNGVIAGGALIAGVHRRPRATEATAPLNILILGGTGFIGPHLVRDASSRGHKLTIFTRGRHDADLPAGVVRLQGDRNGKLESLVGKKWDAVIDDSATNPDWVRQSTALLKDSAGSYLFTSSTGVYYPYLSRGVDERTPIHYDVADPKDGSETFGVAKAQCERLTLDAFGDRGIVVRPTYIVGPGDTSDRFPYWPQRLMRGGEVLAPGRRTDPVQIIDVRDLAAFMVTLLEQRRGGIYNAAGPRQPMTAYEFYDAAARDLGVTVKLTHVDDYAFLAAHGIEEAIPWAMLKGNDDGMMSVKNTKAISAGLSFRPLADTVRDTLAWWGTVPEARRTRPKFTIQPEQESKALAEWHAR
jgi:2'-hydroxyisoflavone reductase